MAPRKRKNDPKQHSLEEVTEEPVTVKRSKKGDLAHPEIHKDETEDLAKRKLARKHQGGACYTTLLHIAGTLARSIKRHFEKL